MTKTQLEKTLHLPDLVIRGFRGIENLKIDRLGQVTLLTGKNAVGKSTVLDAVRLYAGRGSAAEVRALLRKREESTSFPLGEDDPVAGSDATALFTDGRVASDTEIVIGGKDLSNQLKFSLGDYSDDMWNEIDSALLDRGDKILVSTFNDVSVVLPWVIAFGQEVGSFEVRRIRRLRDASAKLNCHTLGPGLPLNDDLDRMWNFVVREGKEKDAEKALELVIGGEVERLDFVYDSQNSERTRSFRQREGRKPIVRIKPSKESVPLKRYGDGALRLLGIALALGNSRGGFLLVDEIENGIHYSVQTDMWRMIFELAIQFNVQILATTHSSDCVRSFARAAVKNKAVDGELVRLNVFDDVLYADPYSEQQVADAAENSIDLR